MEGHVQHQPLAGKVALVTGAARGLGRAYALRLAALGADVAINDIDLAAAKEYPEFERLTAPTVMDEVRALGRRSIGIESSVAEKAACDEAARRTVEELGRLDILVCNAGGLMENYLESYAGSVAEEDLRKTMDRNLYGTIFSCQAALPYMKDNGWGKIVTVSSTNGIRASTDGFYASYGAAKGAVTTYTMYLADEVGQYGITANAIAPGYILTGRMLSRVKDPAANNARAQGVALRRWGQPEDCANVIEFLCTPLSDYVTGQLIVIDGGMTLRDPTT